MKTISYLSLKRYEGLYEQFLADERNDLEPCEMVLGDNFYESSVKTIFEHILLLHIKSSGVILIENTCVPEEHGRPPEFSHCDYCENSRKKHQNKMISVGEFLKKIFVESHWYEKADFETMKKPDQLQCANSIIYFANLSLKGKFEEERFIQKPSDSKKRIEKIREGNKKINP